MVIKLESDVRKIMRKWCPAESIVWIEAARGGTPGHPDMTLLATKPPQYIELKRGTLKGQFLSVELRPDQYKVIRQMFSYNVRVLIIGGLIGTEDLYCEWGDIVINNGALLGHRLYNYESLQLISEGYLLLPLLNYPVR